jgi:hypothetical protein
MVNHAIITPVDGAADQASKSSEVLFLIEPMVAEAIGEILRNIVFDNPTHDVDAWQKTRLAGLASEPRGRDSGGTRRARRTDKPFHLARLRATPNSHQLPKS